MIDKKRAATQVTMPTDREIVITRVFDAPRELVFKAWSDPVYLAKWWGPSGWTLPVSQMDFRVGGSWTYCMKGPEGEESCGMAIYREIVEPERIVFTDYFADAEGKPLEGMPEALMIVEFAADEGKTMLTNTVRYQTAEDRDRILKMGFKEGMTESLNRLEEFLANA
jgi:uncharacterized protein YndB with AHSA1/START domain